MLELPESKRNEELGRALVESGWYQNVPTKGSTDTKQVPEPPIKIPTVKTCTQTQVLSVPI
jgi:hypothetical protein